ncbi:uncharacterized protein LOC143599350 [Bidens hawaiensis]|uniref:uncharacterized protein LOC143599350 n=1 Tax=Bidens hawaiensis TaxID=980011 RepID=UPI0040498323
MMHSQHFHFPHTKLLLFLKPPHSNHQPTFSFLTTTTTTSICCSSSNSNSNDGPKKQRPTPRTRRYGSSRKSVLRKTFKQEQVTFTAPLSDDPLVAIIGGGMSGLLCALQLEKRGVRSTVFDTGIHGLGGRMGTRTIHDEMVFDHAAQFFTVTDSAFADLVDEWSRKGFVRQSQRVIGELQPGGHFLPFLSSTPRYIAVNGMRTLADSMLSQSSLIEVVRPCWISSMEPYNGMWHLSENGKHRGQFDATVIAHNGKCANRLLSTSGLPLIARQMKRLELSSIWALLAAFDDPLPLPGRIVTPFEGAFVKGIDSLSWMGNNTQKLSNSQNVGPPHCWTFFSTASFGKRNKVPQENIPNATAEKVKQMMLAGVENALGLETGSLKTPTYTRVQLWGAALPTNTPGIPCIFDPLGRTGICGDWLLGSSLEAAALSGLSLGNHIADFLKSGGSQPDEFAVGLHEEFHPLQGHDIGQFPGLEANKDIREAEVQVGA